MVQAAAARRNKNVKSLPVVTKTVKKAVAKKRKNAKRVTETVAKKAKMQGRVAKKAAPVKNNLA